MRYDAAETETDTGLSSGDPILLLYQTVRGARSVSGQLLAEPFLQLPSRREYPDYYQQIKNPVSLQQIRYVLESLSICTHLHLIHICKAQTLNQSTLFFKGKDEEWGL